MAIYPLTAHALVPDTAYHQALLTSAAAREQAAFSVLQPRLDYALQQLMQPCAVSDFLLLKMPDEALYLELLAAVTRSKLAARNGAPAKLYGGRYLVDNQQITLQPAEQPTDNFAATGEVLAAEWLEFETLFGCVRQFSGQISLQPGLIHQSNGGVLILSLRAILSQPLLWLRLKQMTEQGYFHWYAPDETRPLPVSVPPLPLQLKIILVGDRELLAEFQQLEPVLSQLAIYSEFADELLLTDADSTANWCQWVRDIASQQQLPQPDSCGWSALIYGAIRHTGDQGVLPLSPGWLIRELREITAFCDGVSFNGQQYQQMLRQREWRENGLYQRLQNEILTQQIILETEGQRVGQVNALTVVEYPGHPRAFGEPSRLTCVAHIGDGEITDVERKTELGGNIHAKGMMIMQAFLLAELRLEQQIPFSASLTFEQSYSEIDGDSASMAELCALISALANVPLYQHIAITGAVDQFGHSMSVGGINEKIEGFFNICQQRGLTGQQGVILPASNVRHLCLNPAICEAVDNGEFHLWATEHVADALLLLTGLPWDGEGQETLLQLIQARIAQTVASENRHRHRWCKWAKYTKWFSRQPAE